MVSRIVKNPHLQVCWWISNHGHSQDASSDFVQIMTRALENLN